MPSSATQNNNTAPVERLLEPPSMALRYACAGAMLSIFGVWGKYSFVEESTAPQIGSPMHGYQVPLALTTGYILSLPILRWVTSNFIAPHVDVKLLLKETMVVYNAGQVCLNLWMVYRFLDAVIFRGHRFVGDLDTTTTGVTFAVWIHYTDKYLEFFDTFFMVLRGRMDQVSFLHVYHHVSIAWAWWIGMTLWPGGDCYFGALLNSWIHVMMYSYYTLSLLKIPCPWKRFLTQAQLLQFMSVVIYSIVSTYKLSQNERRENKYFVALGVQVFEMVSLFVLFLNFYSKAYAKKKRDAKRNGSDSTESSETIPEQESVDSDSTGADKKDQ